MARVAVASAGEVAVVAVTAEGSVVAVAVPAEAVVASVAVAVVRRAAVAVAVDAVVAVVAVAAVAPVALEPRRWRWSPIDTPACLSPAARTTICSSPVTWCPAIPSTTRRRSLPM